MNLACTVLKAKKTLTMKLAISEDYDYCSKQIADRLLGFCSAVKVFFLNMDASPEKIKDTPIYQFSGLPVGKVL